jgi:hypothetical protein
MADGHHTKDQEPVGNVICSRMRGCVTAPAMLYCRQHENTECNKRAVHMYSRLRIYSHGQFLFTFF